MYNYMLQSVFQSDASCRPYVEISSGTLQFATDLIPKPPGNLNINITVEHEGSCGSETLSTCYTLHVLTSNTQVNDLNTLMNSPAVGAVVSGESMTVDVSNLNEGFQLYFVGSSSSLNITRVRVTYEVCVAATMSRVEYAETIVGRSTTGSCVANSAAVSTPLDAVCQSNAMFTSSLACQCNAGYSPSSDRSQCTGES